MRAYIFFCGIILRNFFLEQFFFGFSTFCGYIAINWQNICYHSENSLMGGFIRKQLAVNNVQILNNKEGLQKGIDGKIKRVFLIVLCS